MANPKKGSWENLPKKGSAENPEGLFDALIRKNSFGEDSGWYRPTGGMANGTWDGAAWYWTAVELMNPDYGWSVAPYPTGTLKASDTEKFAAIPDAETVLPKGTLSIESFSEAGGWEPAASPFFGPLENVRPSFATGFRKGLREFLSSSKFRCRDAKSGTTVWETDLRIGTLSLN